LTQALKPENLVRFTVCQALDQLAGRNSAIPALIGALDEQFGASYPIVDFGGDWQVCAAAASALAELAPRRRLLCCLTQALESSHSETIAAACRSLGSLAQKPNQQYQLAWLTQHEDNNVRIGCSQSLALESLLCQD